MLDFSTASRCNYLRASFRRGIPHIAHFLLFQHRVHARGLLTTTSSRHRRASARLPLPPAAAFATFIRTTLVHHGQGNRSSHSHSASQAPPNISRVPLPYPLPLHTRQVPRPSDRRDGICPPVTYSAVPATQHISDAAAHIEGSRHQGPHMGQQVHSSGTPRYRSPGRAAVGR